MTISTDNVDAEIVEKPRRWDITFIRKFMLVFGLLSTIFDYIVFFTLLYILNSTLDGFRTTWFVESNICLLNSSRSSDTKIFLEK